MIQYETGKKGKQANDFRPIQMSVGRPFREML